MGPRAASNSEPGPVVVYAKAKGVTVWDVDDNRYVDLAAGFGSLLLGHRPERVVSALVEQSQTLLQSLGDVHPSRVKISLLEKLSQLHPSGQGLSILGQSGADAISAALKTAVLHTGRSGVIAFGGAYHGLSYGPLSLCGLRSSYGAPFAEQLNDQVTFVGYPESDATLSECLREVAAQLSTRRVGAVVFEPIAGRAGCLVPPASFAPELSALCREHGALLIADEIWTGLGRAGSWLYSSGEGFGADVVCLGKGLGGGLPISACIGAPQVMSSWSREEEVVHTSTFAGAPLAASTALALLEELEQGQFVERARSLGQQWLDELRLGLESLPVVRAVRGVGLMIGLEFQGNIASRLQQALLAEGYLVSLGGGGRESVILTPPLNIARSTLQRFTQVLVRCLTGM